MKLSEIGTGVESLPGVGPATAKQFSRLNIFTVSDLLSSYPRNYEDRTKRVNLCDFAQHAKVHTVCKVMAHTWFGFGAMRTLKIAITDGTANAWLVAFNRAFLQNALPVGSIAVVTGSFQLRYNELQASSFEVQKLAAVGELEDFQHIQLPDSRIFPIYALTEGLANKTVCKAVATALKQYGKAIDNELPDTIIQDRKLLPKAQAVRLVHSPESIAQMQEARKTLVYEELYFFEYKMALRALAHRGTLPSQEETAVFELARNSAPPPSAAPYFTTPDSIRDSFIKALSPLQTKLHQGLPFPLTDDQMRVIMEMGADIDRSETDLNALLNAPDKLDGIPFSMQRLLQGDVGSGKTLVCFFICLRVIDYGGQCVLMAPTELLARQHAENAAKLLEPLGVHVAFLTGNLKASGRGRLLQAVKDGSVHIVVGTHALYGQSVTYKKLHLAIIDEQHRFGVTQREAIVAKGRVSHKELSHAPDLLMMSATPIPQTLALTVFGDLDVSTIRTMPPGRKSVKTYLCRMGNEHNVYSAVQKELEAGHQAYFVYPRISEGEEAEDAEALKNEVLKSAEEMFTFLSKKVYKSYSCALIHSKVAEEEQHKILEDFRANKTQVLVATTVVEVGVDVPNATCIVIEHADRFGLAELHQLRGRVGRGLFQSYCFLIYGKNITETGIARMKALHESTDGFVIAEEDLKLRGPGEVNGTAQSGYLALGIADLSRDREMLAMARHDAFMQLKKERNL